LVDAVERAVRTAAQAAVAVIGVSAAVVEDVDWRRVASSALLAAAVSLLTSIAGGAVGDPDTASLLRR
jgi:tetrahydromethanopterin S-methyltransferase subunit C